MAADNAGKSVHVGLSKTAIDDITIASKSTWEDITKSAKKGLMKVRNVSKTKLVKADALLHIFQILKINLLQFNIDAW